MLEFTMFQKTKLIYGNGIIRQLGEFVSETNHQKVMLVSDEDTIAAGIVQKAVASLEAKNIPFVLFDKVSVPSIHLVEKGTKVCRENRCDMVVGIGGAGCIDVAKAINVFRTYKGQDVPDEGVKEKIKDTEGLAVIPTTAVAASKISDMINLTGTDAAGKFPALQSKIAPEFAIVDPELIITMPESLTVSTGMAVLARAMEGYTATTANDYTDFICEKLIETLVDYLPMAVHDGFKLEAKRKMVAAATLGGWMLNNVHTHLGHAIARTIGKMYDIPHGYAVSYALPYAMEHIASGNPEKIKNLIRMFGREISGQETIEELGSILRELISEFTASLRIEPKLPENKEYSFEEAAEKMITEVHNGFSPVKLTKDDAIQMLERMFEKEVIYS